LRKQGEEAADTVAVAHTAAALIAPAIGFTVYTSVGMRTARGGTPVRAYIAMYPLEQDASRRALELADAFGIYTDRISAAWNPRSGRAGSPICGRG